MSDWYEDGVTKILDETAEEFGVKAETLRAIFGRWEAMGLLDYDVTKEVIIQRNEEQEEEEEDDND